MAVIDVGEGVAVSTWKVPGSNPATANHSGRCRFSHTRDGQMVCVGTMVVQPTGTSKAVAWYAHVS